MKCQHMSVSRDSTWKQCRQKYKYKYHLEIVKDGPPADYLIFGKAVHKIIEIYTKDKGVSDIGTIAKQVLNGDIEIEPGQKAVLPIYYKNQIKTHLYNFLKLSDKLGFDGEVEWKFNIDLDLPNNKILTGFIDRMVPKKDHFIIIDYKTTKPGAWRKTRETVIHDLQLQCYAWVVMNQFKVDPKKIITALYYLSDGELVSVSFSNKTLNRVPEYLLESFLDIENTNSDNVIGTTGSHCKNCDYNNICPFWLKYYDKKFIKG